MNPLLVNSNIYFVGFNLSNAVLDTMIFSRCYR